MSLECPSDIDNTTTSLYKHKYNSQDPPSLLSSKVLLTSLHLPEQRLALQLRFRDLNYKHTQKLEHHLSKERHLDPQLENLSLQPAPFLPKLRQAGLRAA